MFEQCACFVHTPLADPREPEQKAGGATLDPGAGLGGDFDRAAKTLQICRPRSQ